MDQKILHVVGDSKFGGGGVLITRLAQCAMQHGYDVAVLATNERMKMVLAQAGVKVADCDCIWRPIRLFRDLAGLLKLRRYLRFNRFDVVHTHTSKAGFVGRVAARWADVPVVIHTVHGFAFHEGSSRLTLSTYALLERFAARYCDALVTVSKYHCAWSERLGIGNESTRMAIPNGIDPLRISAVRSRDAIRSELGMERNVTMCLTTGRLAKQKGIDVLLRAVPFIRDEPGIRWFLAGEGEERSKLECLAQELGVSEKVIFLGFRTDLGDLLAAADIVVLPTMREGLSISLLEAMAAGKAIITTDIGSNMEVTCGGRVARIVGAGSVDELAEAIATLASDRKLREEMGIKASAEFHRNYREEVMLGRYMALYARLLDEKCRQRL